MAIDSKSVYFITTNSVNKVPVGGGPPTILASIANEAETPTGSMAIDATGVYWAATGIDLAEVFKVGLGGGDAETVAGQEPNPTLIAVDATHLYRAWSDEIVADANPNAGGTSIVVASG